MSIQVIDKYNNNIFSTDFIYNYIQPNKYNISYKTYIYPQLIYIYNFLKKKLPPDCILKIIKCYIETSVSKEHKYSINKYLHYYTHCIATYSENNQKYKLTCINYNTNSCGVHIHYININ